MTRRETNGWAHGSQPSRQRDGPLAACLGRACFRRFKSALVLAAALAAAGCSVMQPASRHQAPVVDALPRPAPPSSQASPATGASTAPPASPSAGGQAARPSRPNAALDGAAPSGGLPEVQVPKVEPIIEGPPNVPYVIDGVAYVPQRRDVAMAQVGLASWYGVPFHGRKTANGERYDMHRLTAAHKTMPLPSYAVVRHRGNGREVVVRVNDRGPFKPGRIIDLSMAAAKVLGITGLAQVEVVRLTHADIRQGAGRPPAVARGTVAPKGQATRKGFLAQSPIMQANAKTLR